MPDRAAVIDRLATLFAERGAREYLGEPVSVAEHMLQTAALAEAAGGSDELVVASLLHDIGHLLEPDSAEALDAGEDRYHENLGCADLAAHFPPAVTEPVRMHVDAKRYLCAIEPAYVHGLSDASRRSLAAQGGPMSPEETRAFAENPHHETALALRRFDDAGKVAGHPVPGFDHYRPVLERVLAAADR